MKTNDFQATLATLKPHVRKGVEAVLGSARRIFDGDPERGCAPMALAILPGTDKFGVIGFGQFDDQTKPTVWAMVRKLRRECPTVAFVSEAWMSHPKKGDTNYDYDPVTQMCKMMPRDDPNRTEAVMLHLWEGIRVVSFKATITRHPDKLGEWEVLYDSFFPGNDGSSPARAEGAMMDGEPCAQEGN